MSEFYREITSLTSFDCFTIFSREKKDFDFPIHHHEEFELNLILHGKGVKRIVGNHIGVIDDAELVLVGSHLPHAWFTHQYQWTEGLPLIYEVTIQFHKDLFDEKLLQRNQLTFIKALFKKAEQGILFSKETTLNIRERIENLSKINGFLSVLELMSILHELSISPNAISLSSNTFQNDETLRFNSRRLETVFTYMQTHFQEDIPLSKVAQLAGMTEVSFSRFIKKRTGRTFVESLNDVRLGHAARMLIETTHTIAEIAYNNGFNNLSYFNRIFKNKHGITPKEFRESYSGTKTFI
ncbi:MAG: helix-turn-helix domain-containing protein [Saprospiraceae bacterium]|nr:helix-turn-helix domain-containing protein [Saprospiraceae bacterium]